MASQSGLPARSLLGVLIRKATRWVLTSGVLCVVAGLTSQGLAGLVSAALGVAAVLFFYLSDAAVLRLTREREPAVTGVALMGGYVTKVAVLALALWLLDTETSLNLRWLAVTVVVMTIAGVAGLTAAALRTKSFFFDT